MRKTLFSILFAAALVIGAGISFAEAQSGCPAGKECGWIDVSNVTAYGVTKVTNNGQNFINEGPTADHLCKLRGYDSYTYVANLGRYSKCNNETFVRWNGSDWSYFGCTSSKWLAQIYCQKEVPSAPPTISWSSAPSNASCNANYKIEAVGRDADGNLSAVSIDKDGTPFAYAGGGDGSEETSGNPTSDTGPKKVTFTAWAQDSAGGRSATISHTVDIASCEAPKVEEPKGNLDAARCDIIGGWAYNPVDPNASIDVHFYLDGAFMAAANANGSRPDVNNAFGIGGNHGFTISTPDSAKTGADRALRVYAIGGSNPLIGSGTLNCPPPTIPAPTGFITASPGSVNKGGGDATISWSVASASSCTASGDWTGGKSTSGSETRRVTRPSTFTLTCTGGGGTWSESATVGVKGTLSITDFYISPNTVKTGDYFTIFAVSEWNGADYLKRHRAYFADSYGEKRWTDAGGPFATVLTTAGSYIKAEKNQYSMREGAGHTYTIVYEVEDAAGNTASDTRTLVYLPEAGGNACVGEEVTHTCSASYSGYEFSKSQSTQTLTVYQSCSISEEAHAALNIPAGTATLAPNGRDQSPDCPQCWTDLHQYKGTSWYCSRSVGGYDYAYFKSTFPVTYYTSCSISPQEKTALQNEGYTYEGVKRTYSGGPGQWTDVHTMSKCPIDPGSGGTTGPGTDNPGNNPNPNVPGPVTPAIPGGPNAGGPGGPAAPALCTDPNASNFNGPLPCLLPAFTLSAHPSTVRAKSIAGYSGITEREVLISVNPVYGFDAPVRIEVDQSSLPASTKPEYSFGGGEFTHNPSAVMTFDGSLYKSGGIIYVPVVIRFGGVLEKDKNYSLIIQGRGLPGGRGNGFAATTVVNIDSKPLYPGYNEI